MRRSLPVLALLPAFLLCTSVQGQGFGVGVKGGTIGFGVEGALSLGSRLDLRGGGALLPIEFDQEIEDIDFTLELPQSFLNIGIDLFPGGGGFHVSGGLLFKPDEPVLSGTCTGNKQFGGQTYDCSQVGTITGKIESNDVAPYLLIGFGRHTSRGVGLFLDAGVGFQGDPSVVLTTDGAVSQQDLDAEAQDIEDELGGYLQFYPILQIGLRIGLGG